MSSALDEIGGGFDTARLSTSRSLTIDRGGVDLSVVTPKKVTLKIAGRKPIERKIAALTVEDALKRMDVKVDDTDQARPGFGHELEDGDTITFTDVRVVKKRISDEAIDFDTVEQDDDSMEQGETEVSQEGREGLRDVTYRLVFKNGDLAVRKVLDADVTREPTDQVVQVGTQEPEPEVAAPNFAGGSTVWDSLAQCESGGNWAINTGNGYYGGLQFNLGTWQSYGGSGLPSNNSRETQIAIATKVRDASGGYGAWPGCASSLGLPR